MNLKAMETFGLFPVVIELLGKHLDLIVKGRELAHAGRELLKWFDICASQPRVMCESAATELLSCAIRHVCIARDGGVHVLPKHHAFLELSARIFILCMS